MAKRTIYVIIKIIIGYMDRYTALLFEGGGMKGMCFVGALLELTKEGDDRCNHCPLDMSKVGYYGGTSAGSIFATLLASGHSPQEIEQIMYDTKWGRLNDGGWWFFPNIVRLFRGFGYHKGQFIEKLIDRLLHKKTGIRNITFEQLHNITNNHLKMVGTNLTIGRTEYMDHILTPHMPVAKAVQISACIPFVFEPVKYNGAMYVDGGLVKNFDLDMFSEHKPMTLAFDIDDTKEERISNIMVYFMKMFQLIHKKANAYDPETLRNISILRIHEPEVSPFDFKISKDQLTHMKQVGMCYAHKFVAAYKYA